MSDLRQLERRWIGIETESEQCWLTWGYDKEHVRRLKVDVQAPCYVLLWQSEPGRSSRSGWTPVGGAGDPMAFRYRVSGHEITAISVIGDEIPEVLRAGDRFQAAQRRGYHCRGSAQGVLFASDEARTVPKRNQVGLFCVEIPVDEASFWLTTRG